MAMNRLGTAEKAWLLLVGLTLVGAWLGETGVAGWPLTLIVASLIAVKGRLIVDHYMEMTTAHARLRQVLYAFVGIIPLLVVLNHDW
jgi:heme/copper-type cytochrome/quinol oxidase subunit 4